MVNDYYVDIHLNLESASITLDNEIIEGVKMQAKIENVVQALVGNFAKYLLLFTTIISLTYLLVYYHDSGDMHDAGVYFNSGLAVLRGDNPYVSSRWGTFGPVPFSILLSVIPIEARAVVVRILSLVGTYLFFRIIFPNKRLIEPFAISLVLLWLSPFRELMVTNQMTGITIGLLAIGVKFLDSFSSFRHITTKAIIGSLLFSMALDLKPHICLFFFVSWAIYHKSLPKFCIVVLALFITHSIINLSQMRILELDWFSALKNLNESASQNSLGDSLSFWPIINYYLEAPILIYVLSIITPLLLSLLCFYYARKGKWEVTVILSFFIPATSIYYHYYDAVPLCVVFVVMLFRINNISLATFTVSFILIPKEYLIARNQILILAIVALFVLFEIIRNKEAGTLKILLSALLGVTISFLLHIFNTNLELSDHLLQSLIVTETLMMIIGLFVYTRVKKISTI